MGSVQFPTFTTVTTTATNTPAFWRVAEDEGRGIQVIRLHPQAKKSELEARVRAEFPRCEFHWPGPDPGSESEHRGDCWLVFPGAGDAARALAALRGWKFGPWHIKTQRAKRETPPAGAAAATPVSPLLSLNSPPPPLLLPPEPTAAAPSPPIAFVNTTTGDVTIVTRVAPGPPADPDRRMGRAGIETSPAILGDLLDWPKWGTQESR